MRSKMTLTDIKYAQKAAAEAKDRAWWFGPSETRFFDAKYERPVYESSDGRYFFVASTQFVGSDGKKAPRRWYVHIWDPKKPESIETHGGHDKTYGFREDALDAAKKAAKSTY